MDAWVKLNSSSLGKDRLIRLLQYGSKLLWYLLEQTKLQAGLAVKLKNLEYHFGTCRKLLRLGKFIEVITGALATLHSSDKVYKVALTLSKVAQSCFLLADNILWFGRAALFNPKKAWWSSVANRCWLYSIVLNLLRDAYEIHLVLKAKLTSKNKDNRSVRAALDSPFLLLQRAVGAAKLVVRSRPEVAMDTVKNLCDFFIPLTSQGHAKLNPGVIGALGMVSSIIGILTVLNVSYKLSPS